MTDQEINEAIAAACGGSIDGDEIVLTINGDICGFGLFTYDLNAMHEAEKVLTKDQQPYYFRFLCPDEWVWIDHNAWPVLCFATSKQRAEAFLRTLGKWKD